VSVDLDGNESIVFTRVAAPNEDEENESSGVLTGPTV
jgi:hypothetical protein